MRGFITDKDLDAAEEVFPGIHDYFDALDAKPGTFLELVAEYEGWVSDRASCAATPSGR